MEKRLLLDSQWLTRCLMHFVACASGHIIVKTSFCKDEGFPLGQICVCFFTKINGPPMEINET